MKNFLFHLRACAAQVLRGEPNPQRDWAVMLTASLLVLAGIIVWNAWAFNTVATGGVLGSAATSTFPTFSQDALSTIHEVFVDRAAERIKYETGTYRFADPSQ